MAAENTRVGSGLRGDFSCFNEAAAHGRGKRAVEAADAWGPWLQ